MCGICGCDDGKAIVDEGHEHESLQGHSGADHSHHHEPGHTHDHALRLVELESRVLAKNDGLATANRSWFRSKNIISINLMSAPGAGKTTLLERTILTVGVEMAISVIEGDQATTNDADRIRRAGAPVVQLNTGTGCHLDAEMVRRGCLQLAPRANSLVIIENVGNLICPALFDLGERYRVAILSVTEGDDKPLKYPHLFASADLALINKSDLLPYVDFSVAKATENLLMVNPEIRVLVVSARTGEGLPDWHAWLAERILEGREGRTADVLTV